MFFFIFCCTFCSLHFMYKSLTYFELIFVFVLIFAYYSFYEFVRATKAKYHCLSALHSRNLFFHSSGGRTSKIKNQQSWFPLRPLPWACRCQSPLCIPKRSASSLGCLCPGILFYWRQSWDLGPPMQPRLTLNVY